MKRILFSLSLAAVIIACGDNPGTESPGYVDSSNVSPNGTVNPGTYEGTGADSGTGTLSDTSSLNNQRDTTTGGTGDTGTSRP